MKRQLIAALLLLTACNGGSKEDSVYELSRTPVSVRGWITDVKGSTRAETMEMEIARRAELFTTASVWVEETEHASGGIAENGAFIVLDVPPEKATLGFNATGAENARVLLEGVPGSADVLIPEIVLEPGGAVLLNPKNVVVRIGARVDAPRATGKTAKIAGHTVPVIEVPMAQMVDRRDYPQPPGIRPVAVVK